MQITTMHTLAFTFQATGNEQHSAAVTIIKRGADTMGVEAKVLALPLVEGTVVDTRTSAVEVTALDRDKLENYWLQAQASLAFIGVEATSP